MHFNRKAAQNALLAFCFVVVVAVGVGVSIWMLTKTTENNTEIESNNTEVCTRNAPACKMATVFPGFSRKPVPMFLDKNFKQLPNISVYGFPFGMKDHLEMVEDIQTHTENLGFGGIEAKRCVVVGNGGVLRNSGMGKVIDSYDVIMRINAAPLKGYERDVGTKTTMRILYPESCPMKPEEVEDQGLYVLLAFKTADLLWFRSMVRKEPPDPKLPFWKPVVQHVPREPADMRILNPHFMREASFELIGLPHNSGKPVWERPHANVPTTGMATLTLALHNCEQVDAVGFGYDLNNPSASLHYYDDLTMAAMTGHNIVKEKQFLGKLLKARVIQDLTGAMLV